MDVQRFDIRELLLAGLKSEIDSRDIYETLASRVKNAFLKDRLKLLAMEEEGHRTSLEAIYRMNFGNEEIVIPEKSPVPLPEPEISSENDPISLVMESAMEAELAAEEFYLALSERFSDERTRDVLEVLAHMEHAHYMILKAEYENMKKFENYDAVWPMMHAGP